MLLERLLQKSAAGCSGSASVVGIALSNGAAHASAMGQARHSTSPTRSQTIEATTFRSKALRGQTLWNKPARLANLIGLRHRRAIFYRDLRALAGEWTATHESRVFSTLPTDPASNWENGSIGAFSDAAVRWADASRDGLRFYDVPTNPWRRMAEIMRAGKEYE